MTSNFELSFTTLSRLTNFVVVKRISLCERGSVENSWG